MDDRQRRWVVRHACAGHKDDWSGPDDLRPLDPGGAEQAAALAPLLAPERPRRLVASPTRRCIETLWPLARALEEPVEEEPALGSGADVDLVRLISGAAYDGAAVCTHGEVMEPALAALRAEGLEVVGDVSDEDLLLKGGAWRLDRRPSGWRLELVVPIPLASCPHHDEGARAR